MIGLLSLQEGIFLRKFGSHTYFVQVSEGLGHTALPNPGYIASLFLEVTRVHFCTTLAAHHQPHTVATQLNYLRPIHGGYGLFKIKDLSLGPQTSVIQVSLIAYDGDLSRQGARIDPARIGDELVSGYITNANMSRFEGTSVGSTFEMDPPPRPARAADLREDKDLSWKLHGCLPFRQTRQGEDTVDFFFEKEPLPPRHTIDQWVRFSDGSSFTNPSLGIIADLCIPKLDTYDDAAGLTELGYDKAVELVVSPSYKTRAVVANMDIRKVLPSGEVDFLFVRVQSKRIHNGRLDAEVLILDPDGELVAICNQMMLEGRLDTSRAPHPRRYLGKI